MASALDHQLNHICIAALVLSRTPMLEPVVATLDVTRKVEILRAFAKHIRAPTWREALKRHASLVKEVNDVRNIAAHSVLSLNAGKAVLFSPAASKLLKTINLRTKTADHVELGRLEAAIRKAKEAYENGANVLLNLEHAAAERRKRHP